MSKLKLFSHHNILFIRSVFNDEACAEYLNQKLSAFIETLPKVYGTTTDSAIWVTENAKHDRVTASARLIFIEEIKPEVCVDHIPHIESRQVMESDSARAYLLGCSIVCARCKKRLKPASWTTEQADTLIAVMNKDTPDEK